MDQTPTAIGLFVCEQVITEEKTRNVTPVNCFTRWKLRSFPTRPLSFVVFAVLNDGIGRVQFDLTIDRSDTTVFDMSAEAQLKSPLQEVRCVFRVSSCVFPSPGTYDVTLLANGEIVAFRTIRLTQEESP